MKRILTLLLLLALAVSVFMACQEAAEGGDETSAQTDAPVSDAVTTGGETTEEPETLVADDGAVITDDALHGWFDYGTALYHRDTFTVGGRESIAISMAKNETEGFQYILASNGGYDDLRCEVSTLTDGNGNTLTGDVYVAYNVYINVSDGIHLRRHTPDPLLPQDHEFVGGTFDVVAGRSKTIYVEYATDKNTVPGTYTGRLEIKQGDEVVLSGDVSVTVWDLYYDEATECITSFGYGAYWDSWEFPFPEGAPNFYDRPELLEIYADYLVENRLSPGTLPYADQFLNEKAAKYMNDPRVTMVTVYGDLANAVLQYETVVENDWMDKVTVLLYDEPHEEKHMLTLLNEVRMWNRKFPTTNHMNPFGHNLEKLGKNTVERFAEFSSFHCMHTNMFDEGVMHQSLKKLQEERGDTVIWYSCFTYEFKSINVLPCTPGNEKRMLYWQQYLLGLDGFLYWQTTAWENFDNIWAADYEEGKPRLPGSMDGATGEGVMLYWDPITDMPVGGLGLESMRDGVEDYQLLAMAEKVLGREAVLEYVTRLTTDIYTYETDPDLLMQARNELAAALLAATAAES